MKTNLLGQITFHNVLLNPLVNTEVLASREEFSEYLFRKEISLYFDFKMSFFFRILTQKPDSNRRWINTNLNLGDEGNNISYVNTIVAISAIDYTKNFI
jgi:hypothetical protein